MINDISSKSISHKKNSKIKKRLKLLFLLNEPYPPFRVDTTVLFGEEMFKRGHIVKYIFKTREHQGKTEKKKWKNAEAWIIKNNSSSSLTAAILRRFHNLQKVLLTYKLAKNSNLDFIQVRDLFLVGALALIATKLCKKRFFFWLSFPIPEMLIYQSRNNLSKYRIIDRIEGEISRFLLYKIIAKYSDHIFVQSEQMKKDLMYHNIANQKMTPIPMGISEEMLSKYEIYKRNLNTSDKKRIIYLGALNRTRKLDFLIRVHKLVLNTVPSSELWFVGKGTCQDDEDFLKNEINRLGIQKESVIFTGHVPIDNALQYVADSDVGLSPLYPTFIFNAASPTKLIEYMALGCPVIGNTHPEQSKILHESNAGLCVDWDEGEFASAIIRLLNDPGCAREMGMCGREWVKRNRTYKHIADDLEAKYLELCS